MRDPKDRSPKGFDHFRRDPRPAGERPNARPDDRRGGYPDRGAPRGGPQGQRPDNRQGGYPDRGRPRGQRPDNRSGGGYPDRGAPRGQRPDDRRGPYPDRGGPQGQRPDQRGRPDPRRPDPRPHDSRPGGHRPHDPRQGAPRPPEPPRPPHLQPQGRAGDPTPFELFCAYHLGIQKDGTYKPANIHTIAKQFNKPSGELKQLLANYGLDPMSVMERDFDLAMAQIDMQLAPEGINKIELARPIFEEFLAAKRKKIDWKKIIEEDIRENAKVFGRRD
jgi:hypothetical protein